MANFHLFFGNKASTAGTTYERSPTADGMLLVDAAQKAGTAIAILSRPMEDVSLGTWQATGGGTLFGVIDEATPDDGDYIYTSSGDCKILLANMPDPGIGTGHVVRYRAWAPAGGGFLTLNLMQGATLIAQKLLLGALTSTPTTYELVLSEAEANSITDYSNISMQFSVIVTEARVSWAEMSISKDVSADLSLLLGGRTDLPLVADVATLDKGAVTGALDGLALVDSPFRDALLGLTDLTALADSSSATRTIAQLFPDGLLFSDNPYRDVVLAVIDRLVLLGESVFKDMLLGARDDLLALDGRTSDLLLINSDQTLLGDTGTPEQFTGGAFVQPPMDGILLDDRALRELILVSRDGLQMLDYRMLYSSVFGISARIITADDGTVTADIITGTADGALTDISLLIRDFVVKEFSLLSSDGIQFYDIRVSEFLSRLADTIGLAEITIDVAKIAGGITDLLVPADNLLIRDQVFREIFAMLSDGVQAYDYRMSELLGIPSSDNIQFYDSRVSELISNLADAMELVEVTTLIEKITSNVVELLVPADGVLMRDEVSRELLLQLLDSITPVEINVEAVKIASGIIELLVPADGVMLSDIDFRELLMAARDGIQVDDIRVNELLRGLFDSLLLGWSASADIVTGVIELLIPADGLLLDVRTVFERLAVLGDILGLSDAVMNELTTELIARDGQVFDDAYSFGYDVSQTEGVLVNDVISVVLEMVARSDLLTDDAAYPQWLGVIVAFLVYARLSAVDLLGIGQKFGGADASLAGLGSIDLLSVSLSHDEVIGSVELSNNRWRVEQ